MKRSLSLLAIALLALPATGCWEQFGEEPPPPPLDDDDDNFGDDDDSADDDDAIDDDDSADDDDAVDDDDSAPPECAPAATMTCGNVLVGNNSQAGSTNLIEDYGCSALVHDAPEFAYEWLAEETGEVAVRISGLTQDLDLYVLAAGVGGACEPGSCVGASTSASPNEEVIFEAVGGNAYHFVVDGYGGGISAYTIELDCDPSGGDDDDSSADDDDSSADDDDSSADDDDDATPDCGQPPSIVPTVTVTDAAGIPATEFSAGNPVTVTLSLENVGGGTQTEVYGSSCLFQWSVWDSGGVPMNAGPSCLAIPTIVDFVCAAPPVVDAYPVDAVEGIAGAPLPSGAYELRVDTYWFGVQVFALTVP